MSISAGSFLGVPDSELRAMGCLTVAAVRLERTIRALLADLYEYPGKRTAGQALKCIRQKAEVAKLPAHSRVDTKHLSDWTRRAGDALYQRHIPVHSAPLMQLQQGEFVPMQLHLRSGDLKRQNAAGLLDAAERIVIIEREGCQLICQLRHNPRKGVYLPNAVVDGDWGPTCVAADGRYARRPTENELDRWWRELGPFPLLARPR